MGGGEEGWGGCGGRGAPPGRKLNINQSIAVSPATQQRRGCGGCRGTGEGWVGGREEGGEGRGEPAVGERCGEHRARRAAEDRWQRTGCRAGRWPRPVGGCARVPAGAGARGLVLLLVAGPGRGCLAQPLGALVPARRRRRRGRSWLPVSRRRRRPTRRRRPRCLGSRCCQLRRVLSTLEIGGLSPPPPTASAHHPPPPPLRATFPGACELPLGAEPAVRARRAAARAGKAASRSEPARPRVPNNSPAVPNGRSTGPARRAAGGTGAGAARGARGGGHPWTTSLEPWRRRRHLEQRGRGRLEAVTRWRRGRWGRLSSGCGAGTPGTPGGSSPGLGAWGGLGGGDPASPSRGRPRGGVPSGSRGGVTEPQTFAHSRGKAARSPAPAAVPI